MGAQLNGSYDLVPAEAMYEACRVMAKHVVHRGGMNWDFSALPGVPIDPEFERLVGEYLQSVLAHDNGPRGWKLPETTLVFPWIVRMFPQAYYISWVRDPRDSIIGAHLTDDLADFAIPYDHTDDVRLRRAISWKYQRLIVAATPRPERIIDVRFEDFVLDQERTLARLERFLGLPLVRIETRTDSIGRWKTDEDVHDFGFLSQDLAELRYGA